MYLCKFFIKLILFNQLYKNDIVISLTKFDIVF